MLVYSKGSSSIDSRIRWRFPRWKRVLKKIEIKVSIRNTAALRKITFKQYHFVLPPHPNRERIYVYPLKLPTVGNSDEFWNSLIVSPCIVQRIIEILGIQGAAQDGRVCALTVNPEKKNRMNPISGMIPYTALMLAQINIMASPSIDIATTTAVTVNMKYSRWSKHAIDRKIDSVVTITMIYQCIYSKLAYSTLLSRYVQ